MSTSLLVMIVASLVVATHQARWCNHPGTIYQGQYCCMTFDAYQSADLSDARYACNDHGLHLATLTDLVSAYEGGFHLKYWGLIDKPGYDAMVYGCAAKYQPDECTVLTSPQETGASSSGGYVPSTPRPSKTERAWCCK